MSCWPWMNNSEAMVHMCLTHVSPSRRIVRHISAGPTAPHGSLLSVKA